MDFSFEGRLIATRVMNAVIESKRRATYNEIQKEWDAGKADPEFPFLPHFELFQILKKRRHARGSIDFDLPEAELRVDESGEPTSITQRPRLDAHRLIEEFMIVANESVTEWALERHYPFIFRVHEEPAEKTLEKFLELCHNSGIEAEIDFEDLTGSIQKLLKLIDGHPAQTLLNSSLLRSMKQAHYTSLHGEHFGLASKAYTHFTSPIRRYPDLLVHRVLKQIVAHEKSAQKLEAKERDELNEMLQDAAEHCSYRERVASEAERESIKLKQARFMLKELGNTFPGKITGMMERGFFVTLDHPYVEGMVSVDSMTDDFYEFKEDRMVFQGKRKKKTFQIGQKIQVTVARVDLETRQIDFALPPDQGGDPTSKARHMKREETLRK
jgi:ribonuclease R